MRKVYINNFNLQSAFFMLLWLLLPLQTNADVMIEKVLKGSSMGGMGSFQSNMTTYFKGDKMREELSTGMPSTGASMPSGMANMPGMSPEMMAKMQSMMKNMPKGMQMPSGMGLPSSQPELTNKTVYIHLPNEGRIVNIKSALGSYIEAPIYYKNMLNENSEMSMLQAADNEIIDEDFQVKFTGESRNILGYDCEEILITWYVETKDINGEKNKSRLTMRGWAANFDDKIKELERSQKQFGTALAKALNLDRSLDEVSMALNLMKLLANVSGDKLVKAIRKLDGYPLAMSVTFETEKMPFAHMMKNKKKSGGMKQMMGMFGGSSSIDGMMTFISFEHEITRLETIPLANSLFEVPRGFNLAKRQPSGRLTNKDIGSAQDDTDKLENPAMISLPKGQQHAGWVNFYNQWQGTDYKYGGMGPPKDRGVDCSALTQRGYRDVLNMKIPRTTQYQIDAGKYVSLVDLQVGDLVFFAFPPDQKTGRSGRHVGIYFGNNEFIHASSSKGVIAAKLNSPYWGKVYEVSVRPE